MNKKLYILFFVALLSGTLFGQRQKDEVAKALSHLQNSDLDSAQFFIDKASIHITLKGQPKTWYYKGFIYKEIYKAKDKTNKTSTYRNEAIVSLKKLLELDKDKEFTESSIKILKYLASTLYNDAARSLNMDEYKIAEENFESFKKLMQIVEPGIDLKQRDIKFKLALASLFSKPNPDGSPIDPEKAKKSIEIYESVLAIDENNGSANYNLGILYYNDAVYIINNMDYDMDLEKLNEVQDQCIDLFLKALPYMKKAYDLNWKKKETLIGLSSIYYGLNDMEKSDAYKKELQELEEGN